MAPTFRGASLVVPWYRIGLLMQETWGLILGSGRSLEKEVATPCSILTWEIPWTEKPVRLQAHKRKRHDLATKQ